MNSINIIAQISVNVNSEVQRQEVKPKGIDKWTEYKKQAGKVAEKMKAIGEGGRAWRMKDCGNFIKYKQCNDCGTFYVEKTNLCRDRFCPVCNWRLSLQRFVQMRGVFEDIYIRYPNAKYSMLTLTVPNCKGEDLGRTITEMNEAWHKICCSRKFKDAVQGTARSTEITYNAETHSFHPHFHVIVMWREVAPMNQYILSRWLTLTNMSGMESKIVAQDEHMLSEKEGKEKGDGILKAVLETFKYAVKNEDLDEMPLGEFHSFVIASRNRRFISLTGEIKDTAQRMKVNTEELEGTETEITVCKACGSINLDTILFEWSFGEQAYKRL